MKDLAQLPLKIWETELLGEWAPTGKEVPRMLERGEGLWLEKDPRLPSDLTSKWEFQAMQNTA